MLTDSADGRGYSSNFPAAVVAVLPGYLHLASPGGELSTEAKLFVYDAVDTPRRFH